MYIYEKLILKRWFSPFGASVANGNYKFFVLIIFYGFFFKREVKIYDKKIREFLLLTLGLVRKFVCKFDNTGLRFMLLSWDMIENQVEG